MKNHVDYVAISDDISEMYNLTDDVKHSRFYIRNELNRITFVYDRLLGLTPEQLMEKGIMI